MQLDFISIEDFLEVINLTLLSSIPLNQNPHFLDLSANHLKTNSHLLTHSCFGESQIHPFFIWIKNQHGETLGFLPLLQVENSQNAIHLIPAKKIEESILYKHESLNSKNILLLEQELTQKIGKIHCQAANIGWDLSASLFSVFRWFPESERKEMVKKSADIHFKEVSYSEGKEKLKKFYEDDLEKKKSFPGLIRRNVDLFQNTFHDYYRLMIIEFNKEIIGVMSFIDYLDKIYQMEFLGNTTFNKFYPKILFLSFQAFKKEKKRAVYTAFFEWCLIPFIAEMVRKNNIDMSLFLKKSAQMKARNIQELDL